MNKKEAGARVVAIRDGRDGVINVFGRGVYVGDEPCPLLDGIKNPKIELDGGGVVWGCQCWWLSEEGYATNYGHMKEVAVPLPQ